MKKTYVVEFQYMDGNTERVSFTTENISKSISEYGRNRRIIESKILEENQVTVTKQILLG